MLLKMEINGCIIWNKNRHCISSHILLYYLPQHVWKGSVCRENTYSIIPDTPTHFPRLKIWRFLCLETGWEIIFVIYQLNNWALELQCRLKWQEELNSRRRHLEWGFHHKCLGTVNINFNKKFDWCIIKINYHTFLLL